MIIVVMGVTGAGKTLVGTLLATQLGWSFYDADDYHPAENVEKMRRGVPLTDRDRAPWLDALCGLLSDAAGRGEDAVLACSALKDAYRRRLQRCGALGVRFVFLKGDFALIHGRLLQRQGHFMDPALLASQFESLEEPLDQALVVDVQRSPAEIVSYIRKILKV